eukprot:1149345-Pelagomonas_calceolata.AAC.9
MSCWRLPFATRRQQIHELHNGQLLSLLYLFRSAESNTVPCCWKQTCAHLEGQAPLQRLFTSKDLSTLSMPAFASCPKSRRRTHLKGLVHAIDAGLGLARALLGFLLGCFQGVAGLLTNTSHRQEVHLRAQARRYTTCTTA